ncbi:alpha/beta fold hydrolase [Paenibacillus caseinilyticus]|uniref:Alpha/beta hydrolase n=1 Tax=Paenibacillus mucilaginosus K02 TaxID=997761 RepID=I0BH37_9BACL|nr:alpha/beta hydrolase [Paenibacillus mucilaginosus]AFH61684.1 alpha/beta hydrolase [Paenibacillus mucilaginosus K02]
MGVSTVHKVLRAGGAQVHYYVSGQPDRELIVFLHPAFGDHRCFDGQVGHFADNYRVVTVDLIGHGRSQVYDAGLGIESTTGHLLGILAEEGAERCHLVGVSMGALLAQAFAFRHPGKVRSLVSVGGYSIREEHPEIVKAQRAEMLKWLLMGILSMHRFRRYLASVTVIRPEQQEQFYEMACSFTRRSFRVMSGLRHLTGMAPDRPDGPPLLLVCGDRDLPVVKEASIRWQEQEPQSTYVEIEHAGHCANMDAPRTFNEVVTAFLKRGVCG